MLDLKLIQDSYKTINTKLKEVKNVLKKPLTLTEKILYTHLAVDTPLKEYKRGVDYVNFAPDRVLMQDATAQMALLQFMQSK